MSLEREPVFSRPTQKEIEAMAKTLDSGWLGALDILCRKEELSVNDLREIGLTDWMQRELAEGRFSGWEVEDLEQLRELLTGSKSEELDEEGAERLRRSAARLFLAGLTAPLGVDELSHDDSEDSDLDN